MSKLVLTRKAGESVKIGDSLVLTIREVHAKKVYLSSSKGLSHWIGLGDGYTVCDPTCTLIICAINRGVVKLLFEADRSVTIVRTELIK